MNRKGIFLRLSEEDKKLLQDLAKYYSVSEADIIRIAIKEFARNHKEEFVSQR
jgi:predicted DNA-binding protein